jgi:glycosyltransferase involved in cell wall biosynthesis
MRILFTGDADNIHMQRWVAEMHARGCECHVVTRRPAAVPGAAAVHAVRPGADAAGWFLALPRLRALAAQIDPDIVHGHYVTSNGFWAAACGRRPLVLTAWGSDLLVTPNRSSSLRALTRWTLRRADLLTGDSQDLLAAMARYRPRAPCHEITWGADTDRFRPPANPRGTNRLELVSLRMWEPNYNVDVILDALALLRAQAPQVRAHLWLLGGGPQEAALRERARTLGLLEPGRELVSLLGRQDERGMVDVMQRCHVSITVPSSDATSVSLLESMSCGLAIVASDLPANRQWVTPAGGWLVPARDPAPLAAALLAAGRDFDALAAMGRHNRAQALQRASRRVQMDRMLALYQGLLRQRAPSVEQAAR